MFIKTTSNDYKVLRTTASTDGAFSNPSKAATTTKPVNDGVYNLVSDSSTYLDNPASGSSGDNNIRLIFFGTGADNATFSVRVLLWSKVGTLWIPELILNLDGTLSAAVGVSGQVPADTHRFADTLAFTASTSNPSSASIISPTSDSLASITFDSSGAMKVEVLFNKGTATDMNALIRTL
jgi:hypothetical protein